MIRLAGAVICAVLALLAVAPASPATSRAVRARLDGALKQGRESGGAPAATAAVIRCGRLVWSGANGALDLSSKRQATPRTRFVIASTTKPVVATLVMDLVQRGELSLDTPLSDFYPGLPSADKITIRMLLDHTSGLNEYFDDPRIDEVIANHPDHRWTRDEVLSAITKTYFEPGTQSSYSNSAYEVLGGVIEKLTKGTIERAFRTRIARRLKLGRSTFAYRPEQSGLFAHPFLRGSQGLRDAFAPGVGIPSDYWGPVWTDGGLASTAPDIVRFGDALFHGVLLRPDTVAKMTKRNRFGQGLGIDLRTYAGRTWLGHNGAYGGYESELWYERQRGLTIAVLTNAEGSSLATWEKLVTAYGRALPGVQGCHAAP